MKLTRRAFAASGGALFVSAAAAWGATSDPGARRMLEAAVDAFFTGWASGDWTAFLDCCDETMTFQFPVGEQPGRHGPPDGKQALTAWTAAHQAQGNRITESTVDLKLFAADWVIVCDRGSGTIGGARYTGLHAIFMQAGSTGRLVEFREYFGEIAA
ncbi:nuclear transport factor 2 family protein [Rhizobium laguerreae]|uniref:nuclear transport factor 2 family protein n=1 Tax=Rhizobium laguerreae TaxID=1076926 RepID=UPI001478BE48|nr:nuclear transport factor 2 family protein [Rhizobium laguerreae]NNG69317.1 nuclear transport factor 2 family protein [Rhizobium laguerreae]